MAKNSPRKHRPTNAARGYKRPSAFKIEVGPSFARKERSQTTLTERMLLGMVSDVCDVMDANERLLKYIESLMEAHGIKLNCN